MSVKYYISFKAGGYKQLKFIVSLVFRSWSSTLLLGEICYFLNFWDILLAHLPVSIPVISILLCSEDGGSRFLWNSDNDLPEYTV
jgi:hypothetical protein